MSVSTTNAAAVTAVPTTGTAQCTEILISSSSPAHNVVQLSYKVLLSPGTNADGTSAVPSTKSPSSTEVMAFLEIDISEVPLQLQSSDPNTPQPGGDAVRAPIIALNGKGQLLSSLVSTRRSTIKDEEEDEDDDDDEEGTGKTKNKGDLMMAAMNSKSVFRVVLTQDCFVGDASSGSLEAFVSIRFFTQCCSFKTNEQVKIKKTAPLLQQGSPVLVIRSCWWRNVAVITFDTSKGGKTSSSSRPEPIETLTPPPMSVPIILRFASLAGFITNGKTADLQGVTALTQQTFGKTELMISDARMGLLPQRNPLVLFNSPPPATTSTLSFLQRSLGLSGGAAALESNNAAAALNAQAAIPVVKVEGAVMEGRELKNGALRAMWAPKWSAVTPATTGTSTSADGAASSSSSASVMAMEGRWEFYPKPADSLFNSNDAFGLIGGNSKAQADRAARMTQAPELFALIALPFQCFGIPIPPTLISDSDDEEDVTKQSLKLLKRQQQEEEEEAAANQKAAEDLLNAKKKPSPGDAYTPSALFKSFKGFMLSFPLPTPPTEEEEIKRAAKKKALKEAAAAKKKREQAKAARGDDEEDEEEDEEEKRKKKEEEDKKEDEEELEDLPDPFYVMFQSAMWCIAWVWFLRLGWNMISMTMLIAQGGDPVAAMVTPLPSGIPRNV